MPKRKAGIISATDSRADTVTVGACDLWKLWLRRVVETQTDTTRVSPTPLTSTQRLHGQIARVRRSESDRVRRHLAR